MLTGMTSRQRMYLAAITVATAVAAVLEYSHQADLAIFIAAGVALAGLAWLVSFATEALGERFGPAVTGVMQSTLGNLPELFVVLFALKAGEIDGRPDVDPGIVVRKRAAGLGVRTRRRREQGA